MLAKGLAIVGAAGLSLGAGTAFACGSYEEPCEVKLGSYVVATPDGLGPHPTVIFLHGYAAGGYVALNIGEPMIARGFAVIGPQGLEDSNGLATWNIPAATSEGRDEASFLQDVIDDAASRHGVDPDHVILAGHSVGGTMTSYIACEHPGLAEAYAPLSGTFRRPHLALDACEGPVNLFQTHGWADDDVPIEGRSVWGGAIVQGDVFHAMQIWRETNGCSDGTPDSTEIGDFFWLRSWKNCSAGSLEFALHSGGHGIPQGWADTLLDWYQTLP